MPKLKKLSGLFLLAGVLLLPSCGKNAAKPNEPTTTTSQVGEGNLVLMSFAYPGCGPCQAEMPALNRMLMADARLRSRVTRRLFVVAGPGGSGEPVQAASEGWRHDYAPDFDLTVEFWKRKTYERLTMNRSLIVPAAVVQDSKGKSLKVWASGNINPQEIIGFLKASLK